MDKQKRILYENYVPAEECARIIIERDPRLWERTIEDYDFLNVRWGIGDAPLDIDIQYPEEHFAMEDDNLLEKVNDIASKSKLLKQAPIVTSLVEKNISAIIAKEDEELEKLLQGIIMQLIAFHSYEDLKLVFLVKKENLKKWEYVKMLPYVWNNTKQIRFFTDDYDEMKEISKYLETDFNMKM